MKQETSTYYTFTIQKRVHVTDLEPVSVLWHTGSKVQAVRVFRNTVGCELSEAFNLCRQYCEGS